MKHITEEIKTLLKKDLNIMREKALKQVARYYEYISKIDMESYYIGQRDAFDEILKKFFNKE